MGATIVYSAIGTFIVYKLVALFTKGGRINEEIELEGMDIGYHGEQHMVLDKENVGDIIEQTIKIIRGQHGGADLS